MFYNIINKNNGLVSLNDYFAVEIYIIRKYWMPVPIVHKYIVLNDWHHHTPNGCKHKQRFMRISY